MSGLIKELHYQGIQNQTKPADFVNVSIFIDDKLQCNMVSGSDGNFFCSTSALPGNSLIKFANLSKYELIDSSQTTNLHWLANQSGPKDIFLICRKGLVQKIARHYADQVRTKLKKEYDKKCNELAKEKNSGDEDYKKKLISLETDYEAKTMLAAKLSLNFSRMDSAAASSTLNLAFKYYFLGNFDSCYYYLSPDAIRNLGLRGLNEVDQACFLSLLRADLNREKAILNGRHEGDFSKWPALDSLSKLYYEAADSDYLFANQLRGFKDFYTLQNYVIFLLDYPYHRDVTGFIRRCERLLDLEGGNINDSVKICEQYIRAYTSNASSDHADHDNDSIYMHTQYLHYYSPYTDSIRLFTKKLLGFDNRIFAKGDFNSRQILFDYYTKAIDTLSSYSSSTDQIDKEYLSEFMRYAHGSLSLVNNTKAEDKRKYNDLYQSMVDESFDINMKLLFLYMYAPYNNTDSALLYMNRCLNVCNESGYELYDTNDNNYYQYYLLQLIIYFDMAKVPAIKKKNVYRSEIEKLKTLKKNAKKQNIKEDIEYMIKELNDYISGQPSIE